MSNAYVYLHRRGDNGELFYVGIGIRDGRAYDVEHSRSKLWRNVYEKVGRTVEIYRTGLTWAEACEIERELIALYGRRDLGTGCLVNHTVGGDGAKGHKQPPEAIAEHIARSTNWHANPANKESHREKVRNAQNEPDVKARKSTSVANSWRDDEVRAKRSEGIRRSYLDPESKAKRTAAVTEALNRPELKALKAKQTEAMWASDGYREKVRDSLSHDRTLYVFHHPEHGEVVSTVRDMDNQYGTKIKRLVTGLEGRKTDKGWQYVGQFQQAA